MAEKGSARRAATAIRAEGVSHSKAGNSQLARFDGACQHAGILITLTGSYATNTCGLTVDLGARPRGSPICKLARLLVEVGHNPDTLLRIVRDGKPCLRPLALWRWARLTVEEGDSSTRFRAWRPMPEARWDVARITGLSRQGVRGAA